MARSPRPALPISPGLAAAAGGWDGEPWWAAALPDLHGGWPGGVLQASFPSVLLLQLNK